MKRMTIAEERLWRQATEPCSAALNSIVNTIEELFGPLSIAPRLPSSGGPEHDADAVILLCV
jgi:hypothetical protein